MYSGVKSAGNPQDACLDLPAILDTRFSIVSQMGKYCGSRPRLREIIPFYMIHLRMIHRLTRSEECAAA